MVHLADCDGAGQNGSMDGKGNLCTSTGIDRRRRQSSGIVEIRLQKMADRCSRNIENL